LNGLAIASIAGAALILVGLTAHDFWQRFGMRFDSTTAMHSLRGKIFLTFDDGPASARSGSSNSLEEATARKSAILATDPEWNFQASTTENLKRVLAQFDARAIFFVRGDVLEQDSAARALLFELHTAGHVIGNHSFAHHRFREIPPSDAVDQLERTHRLIAKTVPGPVEVFRPPYGQWHIGLTWRAWRRAALRHYALPLGWTHATFDWKMSPADTDPDKLRESVRKFLADAQPCDDAVVLLQHDVWIYSVLFTRLLLQQLAQQPALCLGEPAQLVDHARELTRRAGPGALVFYLRTRIGHIRRRIWLRSAP
jgi:peptidoglycan/xylan/chitin deacetylase (PgdA/CDA1 family)